jgi:ABC-type (unclassified) transport system, ATPase component
MEGSLKMKLVSNNLVKSYHKRVVVNNVDIELEKGEIVGLLGPNGAGKTTTFYMMIGFIKPESGKKSIQDGEWKLTPI